MLISRCSKSLCKLLYVGVSCCEVRSLLSLTDSRLNYKNQKWLKGVWSALWASLECKPSPGRIHGCLLYWPRINPDSKQSFRLGLNRGLNWPWGLHRRMYLVYFVGSGFLCPTPCTVFLFFPPFHILFKIALVFHHILFSPWDSSMNSITPWFLFCFVCLR